jgi:hypothetical protein
MRYMQPDKITLTATSGTFEIQLSSDALDDAIQFFPTYDGLVALAATLEAMGSPEIYMDPSVMHPHLSGLADDFDAQGFVETAYSLSKGGLHTCLGGNA